MAQREIALAIGEATLRVSAFRFLQITALVETGWHRQLSNKVPLLAFYLLLDAEGDDLQDYRDSAGSNTRCAYCGFVGRLAESGHYRAIDIEASISL